MANIVRVAAAGSGKTYTICHEAIDQIIPESDKKIAMISYANRAVDSIKDELCKANEGVIPKKIDVLTWYSFLLDEMIKPYQSAIFEINEIKGINFNAQHLPNFKRQGTRGHYIDANKDLRPDTISELSLRLNSMMNGAVIERLEQIYSHIYVDEVQDMAGYDLDVIAALMRSSIEITVVGDSKQFVYQTNYSRRNQNRSGSNVWNYFKNLQKDVPLVIDKKLVSRRFNAEICAFANSVYPNDDQISTCMNEETGHDGVFLVQFSDVEKLYNKYDPVVLRYDVKTKTKQYAAYNFGECKGMTFDRVLIFPNKPFNRFLFNNVELASPQKYYVGVTRAKYSIDIVINDDGSIPSNFESVKTEVADGTIDEWKWMNNFRSI